MKNISLFLLVITLLSCNLQKEPAQTPSEVLQLFFKNVASGDFEEAKKYSTKEAGESLDKLKKDSHFMLYLKERAEIANTENLLIIEKEEINGDTARIYLDMGKLKAKAPPLVLIKEKGVWKATQKLGN